MAPTEGYFWSVAEDGWAELCTSHNGLTLIVCRTRSSANAERIAYCLTVVEQSEETARRDEAKS